MIIQSALVNGMVQNSQDVTNVKQNQDNKPLVQQTNINIAQQKEIQIKQENVVKKDDADYNQKKFDAKDKGSNEYSGHKNDKKKNIKKEDGKVRVKEQSNFDMRI